MRQFERRTDMAEAQGQHRISMENKVVSSNIRMEQLGWASATVIALLVIGGSLGLIYQGKSIEGLAGIITALAVLLGLYVWARKDQVQEIAKKQAVEMLRTGATPDQLEMLPEKKVAVRPILPTAPT